MIKQLSVFIENKPGRLCQVTKIISDNGINIHALSIADTTDFGILRIIVKDYEKAKRVLKEQGFTVKITDVIAVSLEHTPGSLAGVLKKLEDADISIEYMYAFTSRSDNHDALVILRLSNQEQSVEKLRAMKVDILESDIIDEIDGDTE